MGDVVNATLDVVIPVYQASPGAQECFALDQTFRVLAAYRKTFVAPRGLDVSDYDRRYPAHFRFFDPSAFRSVLDYSRLLVSPAFYEAFDADYLLIVQPDVYLFRDDLPDWLAQDIDYVGAPWPSGIELNVQVGKFAEVGGVVTKAFVGNGGFSLRRRQACLDLIREYPEVAEWFVRTGSNEDLFFSLIGSLSKQFKIPNQMVASRFALELGAERYMTLNGGQLPMGVHAFAKHDPGFWLRHMPPWPGAPLNT